MIVLPCGWIRQEMDRILPVHWQAFLVRSKRMTTLASSESFAVAIVNETLLLEKVEPLNSRHISRRNKFAI